MLPIDLVLVRHGESEGNVARRFSEHGDDSLFTEEFCKRHSSRLKLTDRGQKQADTAGDWIRGNISEHFDRYLVSGYDRAMETAARLKLPEARWFQDFYLRERDMGEFDLMPESRKKTAHGRAFRLYELDPFYWTPPNGESVAQMCLRIDRVLDTLHRECSDKKVIIVCHGMVMWGFMIRIERLTPQAFLARTKDRAFMIRNCQVIHYTRRNPNNGTVSLNCDWARSICPWKPEESNAAWRQITRPTFTNENLMQIVSASPRVVA